MNKLNAFYLSDLFPLPYIGGHQERGNPAIDFRLEDGVVQVTVMGPHGAVRLHCQMGDQAVLALAKWLEMAGDQIWGH